MGGLGGEVEEDEDALGGSGAGVSDNGGDGEFEDFEGAFAEGGRFPAEVDEGGVHRAEVIRAETPVEFGDVEQGRTLGEANFLPVVDEGEAGECEEKDRG